MSLVHSNLTLGSGLCLAGLNSGRRGMFFRNCDVTAHPRKPFSLVHSSQGVLHLTPTLTPSASRGVSVPYVFGPPGCLHGVSMKRHHIPRLLTSAAYMGAVSLAVIRRMIVFSDVERSHLT
ncbi:MAG: hypothetical protein ACRD6W_12600, partial [Nitrososphaerales archaeon]